MLFFFFLQAQHLCLLLFLCLRLVLGGVPGPCQHSVTQDNLLSLNRLVSLPKHQTLFRVQLGRSENLEVCYIKAVFPQILELLSTHFRYVRNSDNRRYVHTLEKVIFHLYSQGCVAEINEEIEDSPVRFIRIVESSPKEALKKVKGVMQKYIGLMTESTGPVNWNCQADYAPQDNSEYTTSTDSSTGINRNS
uniref:Uncharacterized protein n=1 Tax=Mastacembelus armatus TaxID=205130 RepID=A0A3Q3NFC0_9TELE